MRLPLILLAAASLPLLAGCHSADAQPWPELQRARLARLHQPRSPEQALREVLDAAPPPRQPVAAVTEPDDATATATAPPQERQKLDQRLPTRARGARPMREAWQPIEATVDIGVGSVSARFSGTRLDDHTDARFLRARLDAGNGAALHVELWDSDDDLFAKALVNDGVSPGHADAELAGIDLFPHARFDPQLGDVRMPVRVGLFTEWQRIDHQNVDLTRRWLSVGPRVVLEPTLPLVEGADGSLALFGRAGGDLGMAWFTDEYRNGSDRATTLRLGSELGVGLRGRYGRLHTELGYRIVDAAFGGVSTDLLGDRRRAHLERQQFYVGFGITY